MINESVVKTSGEDVTATTTFLTNVATVENVLTSNSTLDYIDVLPLSIPEFMAKPISIYNGTWTTSNVANYELFHQASVYSILSSNDIYASKLKGFENIRGTACFRVVLTANPFQAGRLIASFTPNAQHFTIPKHRVFMLSQCSALPHVTIDCREGAGVLKVPYKSPTPWYNVKAGVYDWGSFTLKVFSPLSTGSAGDVNVRVAVYFWLEDFEGSAPLVPQSGVEAAKPKQRIRAMKGKENEADKQGKTGLISSICDGTVEVAKRLERAVPEISWFCEPVTWVAKGAGAIASWFGWSKPLAENLPVVNIRQKLPHMHLCDGINNAYPLSLKFGNKLETTDMITLEDYDEMSFAYLFSRNQYWDHFSWGAGSVAGTVLTTFSVIPSTFREEMTSTYNSKTAIYDNFVPFAHMTRFFQYWRGSIIVRFEFVKTDFHAGRLMFVYTPSDSYTTAPTITSSAYSMREIVDIREISYIEIELPYMSIFPWNKTSSGDIGQFHVINITPLTAPETVKNSIDILMYARAGADFELSAPMGYVDPPFVPQSGYEVTSGASKEILKTDCTFTKFMMGESICSLRQLLLRYSVLGINSQSFTTTAAGPMFGFNPWSLSALRQNVSTGALSAGPIVSDYFCALLSGFLYSRGTVRVLYNDIFGNNTSVVSVENSNTLVNVSTNSTYRFLNAQSAVTNAYTTKYAGPGVLIDNDMRSYEVAVPYYHNMPFHINDYTSSSNVATLLPWLSVDYGGITSSTTIPRVLRAIGDDFQAGYFIGFLPVLTSYS